MWSRRFLWTGLSSGAVIAALTLAALWLAFFAALGGKDPTRSFANFTIFAAPGVIAYPACWYAIIFRVRDYSLYRTTVLVAATFGAVCGAVAVIMMTGGIYVGITMVLSVAKPWRAVPFVVLGPLAYALWTVIGAVIIIVPYTIIATPMALLHRWLLLRRFASTGPAAPGTRASLPVPQT